MFSSIGWGKKGIYFFCLKYVCVNTMLLSCATAYNYFWQCNHSSDLNVRPPPREGTSYEEKTISILNVSSSTSLRR